MSDAKADDDPQIMKVSDLAISEEREELMRVSLLDETIVVKHINESAITKDQESVSLINESYLLEDQHNLKTSIEDDQILMFDASKLDTSSFNRSRPITEITNYKDISNMKNDQNPDNDASILIRIETEEDDKSNF